jgi:recombination protein RecA
MLLVTDRKTIQIDERKVKREKMSTEKEAKLKALQLSLTNWIKPGKGTVMKMGDKAIVEVETISSGSLGIDLALGLVVTQEEE